MVSSSESQEIERRNVGDSIPDEIMAGVASFEDAFKALEGGGVAVENISDFGTGFTVLPTAEKSRLINVPFVIMEWRFNTGDQGEFVSAAIVTKTGEKLVINDGSTGICDQLRKITARRTADGRTEPQKGLLVEHGLRSSTYDYPDPKTGELRPATTYYLAN